MSYGCSPACFGARLRAAAYDLRRLFYALWVSVLAAVRIKTASGRQVRYRAELLGNRELSLPLSTVQPAEFNKKPRYGSTQRGPEFGSRETFRPRRSIGQIPPLASGRAGARSARPSVWHTGGLGTKHKSTLWLLRALKDQLKELRLSSRSDSRREYLNQAPSLHCMLLHDLGILSNRRRARPCLADPAFVLFKPNEFVLIRLHGRGSGAFERQLTKYLGRNINDAVIISSDATPFGSSGVIPFVVPVVDW